jgi:gamma-glutamylcyclotransferase
MLYFAYGSNMQLDQIRERCPSATFVGKATLEGYRLAFTRKAKGHWRGFGIADVVRMEGGRVWGVVFQIDGIDIGALNRSEGYRPDCERNADRRIEIHVFTDSDTERPLLAHTDVVCEREEPNPAPHRDDVGRIIAGARSWGLPVDDVQELEGIEAAP